MIVEEGKISMDPLKLGGIRDWPIPTTVKQTRSFLGFGNFCRRFITHFSDIAQPLNNLTKTDKRMSRSGIQLLENEAYLRTRPHDSGPLKPFQIESDASKVATRAVLTQ